MKKLLLNQRGFAPAIFLVIIAALGITGVGTVAVSQNSVPGDLLFTLDKTMEEIQITLAGNDKAKAKIKLEIARERIEELEQLATAQRPVDTAITEAQVAVNAATASLSNVATKFKEDKITLTSEDLQALLTQLQNLLIIHQGLIRRVEIKIKDGEIKTKIKLFEQEASESAESIDDDLDDLEDDDKLNDSNQDKDDNDEEEAEDELKSPKPSASVEQDDDDQETPKPTSSSSNSGSGSFGNSDKDNSDDD